MPLFRTLPEVVEAVQWTGKENLPDWVQEITLPMPNGVPEHCLVIRTPLGPLKIKPEAWLVKDRTGDVIVCKPEFFYANYVKVEDEKTREEREMEDLESLASLMDKVGPVNVLEGIQSMCLAHADFPRGSMSKESRDRFGSLGKYLLGVCKRAGKIMRGSNESKVRDNRKSHP